MKEQESHSNTNQEFDMFEQLEKSLTDPFMERVLTSAREYNLLLADMVDVDQDDRQKIVDNLDNSWGSVKGKHASFTGNVLASVGGEEFELQQKFLDGIRVISNGFAVISSPIIIEGEDVGKASRVVHHLYVKASDLWSEEELGVGADPETVVGVTAEIDGTLLSSFDSASVEFATALLGESCPELLEELDMRIFNTASGEEADSLLALRGFDINKYADTSDEFTRTCIDIYLNHHIDLDNALPYGIGVDGYTLGVKEQEGTLFETKIGQALAFVPALGIQPKVEDGVEVEGAWQIIAYTVITSQSKEDDDTHRMIPIDSLTLMYSLRSAYYGS